MRVAEVALMGAGRLRLPLSVLFSAGHECERSEAVILELDNVAAANFFC